MRVLLDFRVAVGGVGRYGSDLIRAFDALPSGPTLSVISSGRGSSAPFTPWGRLSTARRARRERSDLLHSLHLEAPSRLSIPCVVTVPDVIPLEFPASMPSAAKRAAFRRVLAATVRRADLIIVPSALTRDSLERFGADPSRLREIPWGVGSAFNPLTPDELVAARERFGGGRAYVAAVASDRPHKNLAGLARAATAMSARSDLVVACAGESLPGLDSLSFQGTLSDAELRLLYGGAEVSILPSFAEGFGYPVLESLACGTPVVCDRNVGVLSHVRDAVVVVDVSEAEEIAETVLSVTADDALRARLSARGLEIARGMTTQLMATRTLDVYVEAVG